VRVLTRTMRKITGVSQWRLFGVAPTRSCYTERMASPEDENAKHNQAKDQGADRGNEALALDLKEEGDFDPQFIDRKAQHGF
jgi:hypothetical protein